MSERKAKMFNKKASDPRNKPDQVLKAIGVKNGQSIADIGAGGGYFSLRFAELVGENGKVYAADINQEFLDFIDHSAHKRGLNNLVTLLITADALDLPAESLDFIFMRNVTHHIPNRVAYFKHLQRFLKAGGRLLIIEYKPGRPWTFRGMFGHSVPKGTIMREMEEAGYRMEKEFDFLPEQHFTMYAKASEVIHKT